MVSARHRTLAYWPLIAAAALLAAAAGHAVEIQLENAGFFGDVRSAYAHVAQAPIVGFAIALAALGMLAIAGRLHRALAGESQAADWLLPALHAVRAMRAYQLGSIVLGAQFTTLIAGELAEERLSRFSGGIGAFLGSGHWTTFAVHIVIGIVFAVALGAAARFVCKHATRIAAAAQAVIEWLAPVPARAHAASPLCRALACNVPAPPILARHIANRPPPISAPVLG